MYDDIVLTLYMHALQRTDVLHLIGDYLPPAQEVQGLEVLHEHLGTVS